MEDLEGDVDFHEWGSLLQGVKKGNNPKLAGKEKPKETSLKEVKSVETGQGQTSTPSVSLTPGHGQTSTPSVSLTPGHGQTSTPSVPLTQTSKPVVKKLPDKSPKPVNKSLAADVGDLAGLIDSLDSSNQKSLAKATALKRLDEKKSELPVADAKREPSSASVASNVKSDSTGDTQKVKNDGIVSESSPQKSQPEAGNETPEKNDGKTEPKPDVSIKPDKKDSISLKNETQNNADDKEKKIVDSKLQANQNLDSSVKAETPSLGADNRKRKSSVSNPEASKSLKVDSVGDTDKKSAVSIEDGQNMDLEIEGEGELESFPVCSEEDARSIDAELVEEMMEDVKRDLMPKQGDKYIVRFSPVELADLAEESVQKLMLAQPNLAFYFKRQGKLKKKKGYAEVYMPSVQDVRDFIQKLLRIKLVELRMEITISLNSPWKDGVVVSLVYWHNKNSSLLKFLQSTEDLNKVTSKGYMEIDQVPATADVLMLKSLFPWSSEVTFPTQRHEISKGFRGPVVIHYKHSALVESLLQCCSDFVYKGSKLSVAVKTMESTTPKQSTVEIKKEAKPTQDRRNSEVKKDSGSVPERRNSSQDRQKQISSQDRQKQISSQDRQKQISSQDRQKQISTPKSDAAKKIKEGNGVKSSSVNKGETKESSASAQDAISSMTLDVCSGMLESINKLKELGTDNPEVLKILQMQNELARLQEALTQSQKKKSTDDLEDPWTVSAADVAEGQGQTQPKDGRKRKESLADKQRKEMEHLEKMIEEADEAKRQREERAKRQIEIEKQKMKELEEKRKSGWARKMIDDAKQGRVTQTPSESPASKEVQRILKMADKKQKEAQNAQKLEKGEEEQQAVSGVVEDQKTSHTESGALPSEDSSQDVTETAGLATDEPGLGDGDVQAKEPDNNMEVDEHQQRPWSPNRSVHEGAPVYTEQEYNQMVSDNTADTKPWDYFVQVVYHSNRGCPVQICPATKFFKTAESFTVHWDVFHKPNVTVKFCQKCNAYFTNGEELVSHFETRHSITDQTEALALTYDAREKVVANPSYRDPGRFLPPDVTK